MNYTSLAALIESTTQNNEPTFVATIPTFVQMAERQIHMEARLPSARKNTTGVTVIGSQFVTLPLDYITGKAIEIVTAAGTVNLLPKSPEFITEMYPVAATVAQPRYYAQYDTTSLMLGPTPDQAYPVNFHYFAVPTSIVTAGNTWLGDNFEHVLLYASLLHAYVFMKGSADIMAYYKAAYDAGITELRVVASNTKQTNFRE